VADAPRPIRRIVLSRTDRVGDLILSTPAIATVRASFPDAHVTIACSAYNAVVMRGSTDVDDVAIVPSQIQPEAFGATMRGVDLAIALAPTSADLRLVGATRAARRIGYTYRRRYLTRLVARRWVTDLLVSAADPEMCDRHPDLIIPHEVEQVLELARRAGARTIVPDLRITISDADRGRVAGLPEDPIVVQLGKRWAERGSTAASLLELFRDLRALGRPVIATYGPDGATLADVVRAAGVADLVVGDLDFGTWAAAFERAACIVTIDTGATHVASAVRRPVVVLFEHAYFRLNSQEWSPYRVPNAVLRKPADESPEALRASRAEIAAAVTALL
jgi:ADP-heptose:LPS heptosyltransferase